VGNCPGCGLASPGNVDFCPNPQCRTYLGWARGAALTQPAGQPTTQIRAVPDSADDPSASPPASEVLDGLRQPGMEAREFGQYRLQSLIGVGGMGEVYQAFDTKRDRVVALKLLRESFSADSDYQRRFRRESHAVARLREPHVIPIHDYGEIDQRLFIDMRLVDGGNNIGTIIANEGSFTPARAVHLISQVADALDAAHADGLVHRDIKPSNVLVTPSDFVYVVDFGIAHAVGHTVTSMTVAGAMVGTPGYMAPERFSGSKVDHRTDVYSLTCLLYECLTGAQPFMGIDLPSLMYAHLHSPPPKPSQANTVAPVEFDAVIARGMAKDPEERFASAGKLAEAARVALATATHEPTPAAPTSHGAVGSAVRPSPAKTPPPISDATVAIEPPISAEPLARANNHAQLRNYSSGADQAERAEQKPAPGEKLAPPSSTGDTVATSPVSSRSSPTLLNVSIGVVLLVTAMVAIVLTYRTVSSQFPGSVPPLIAGSPADRGDNPIISRSVAVPAVGPSVEVGASPGYITVSPNGRLAYIANWTAGVVTVLDTTINKVTATIPMPGPPQYITFTADGNHAYVSIYDKARNVNLVAVLDTATGRVVAQIPVDKRPFALAVAPDQHSVWVASHDTAQIDVIDIASSTIKTRIPVAPNPHWVAFARDGRHVYVANHESNVLSVIDTMTLSVQETIPVGTSPHSIAVSPDGTKVSAVCYDSNNSYVIDTAANKVVATVPVGANPRDITYAPDGQHAYTANEDGGSVSVIDTATNAVTATIPIDSPTSVGVLPNGRQAYVASQNTGKITILDIAR
jgi:YVTN family beta-propeller protein